MTTDAATRQAARATVACTYCNRDAGLVCLTSSGRVTSVHAVRLEAYRNWLLGWLARQGEIDSAEAVVAGLSDEVHDRMAQIDTLETRLEALQAKYDALAAGQPTTQRTFFGACPQKGGTSLAAAQTVIDKWGKGAAVRQFHATGVAPRPKDAGIMHASWKPSAAQITDDWVTKVCANLLAGDCVEVWHEADSKVRKGQLQRADVVARKNAFHDAVKRVRPDLRVVNTLTAWLFEPSAKLDPESWVADVRADVVGIDCDGIRPTKLPYTNYEAETAKVLELIAKYGIPWAAVPEFGCPRLPALDPDGKIRAEYDDHYAGLWSGSGKFLYVTLYEYNSSPNYSLETAAEKSGWAARVGRI